MESILYIHDRAAKLSCTRSPTKMTELTRRTESEKEKMYIKIGHDQF